MDKNDGPVMSLFIPFFLAAGSIRFRPPKCLPSKTGVLGSRRRDSGMVYACSRELLGTYWTSLGAPAGRATNGNAKRFCRRSDGSCLETRTNCAKDAPSIPPLSPALIVDGRQFSVK